MALVVVTAALEQYIGEWGSARISEECRIRLFKNDHTPGPDDVVGDYTEADFGGYDGFRSLDSWDTGGIVVEAPRVVIDHPDVEWEADGMSSNTVYGYYVTDDDDELVWAERRAEGGVVIGSAGQIYRVTPRFSFRSEFPV